MPRPSADSAPGWDSDCCKGCGIGPRGTGPERCTSCHLGAPAVTKLVAKCKNWPPQSSTHHGQVAEAALVTHNAYAGCSQHATCSRVWEQQPLHPKGCQAIAGRPQSISALLADTQAQPSHWLPERTSLQHGLCGAGLPHHIHYHTGQQACVPLRQARKRGAAKEASTVRTECSRALSAMVVASATVMGAPPELVRMPARMSCDGMCELVAQGRHGADRLASTQRGMLPRVQDAHRHRLHLDDRLHSAAGSTDGTCALDCTWARASPVACHG